MDPQTRQFYARNAHELGVRYLAAGSAVVRQWLPALEGRRKVLDVGCGTGRDLCELLRQGFDAYGAEPVPEMRRVAEAVICGQGLSAQGRVLEAALPELEPFDPGEFDAVICSAVLMHMPEAGIFDAAYGLRRVLKPRGLLFLSLPTARPDVDSVSRRDKGGRLFTDLVPARIQLLFERLGFRLDSMGEADDCLGRQDYRWVHFQFTLLDDQTDRPLHLVEGILNRDKKVATYKPALVRALAEIAQTQHHLATFTERGQVKVPVDAIAEKWLLYYWPIFASDTFIRQMNGESETSSKGVAIRAPMMALIEHFRTGGGLSAFYEAWRSDNLDAEAADLLREAKAKLASTIWSMPVKHAGGGEHFSVFSYDNQAHAVVMDAGLWRELCLTGSWIQDATILRWAELTERLSKGRIKASAALDCLLTIPDPERKVADARRHFAGLAGLYCVWTRAALVPGRFDLDHAMPFCLWRNNDLWNLLPTSKAANSKKSDLLPSHDLLLYRREEIIACWRSLHESMEERFVREARTLLGRDDFSPCSWEDLLFSRFVEAFEVTAAQRGVARWQPEELIIPSRRSASRPAPGPTYYPMAEEVIIMEPPASSVQETVIVPFDQVGPDAFVRFLPFVGALAAGDRFHGFETASMEDLAELAWVAIPTRLAGRNRFVVRVAGDSMEPTLRKGDLAVFEYHRSPRCDGDIVVANVPEFGISEIGVEAIKRIRQDAEHWIFQSDNPSYDPLRVAKVDLPAYPILGVFIDTIPIPHPPF